jgi:K+-sensing histidine kinase KdpD
VLAPVISDLSPTLKLQGRKIETDIPEGLMADVPSGAIRHIASILLDNALRHGEGTVGMNVKRSGDWLVLAVTDQGKGLDSDTGDVLKQIDLELNSAAGANKPETIGLTLAMALASAQGGRLEWRPTEPATLRVYLRSMSKDETTISQEPENGA